jgi:hypothetical protein
MIPMPSVVHVFANIASYNKRSEFRILIVGMQIGEEGVGPLVCLTCKSNRIARASLDEWWESVFAHIIALSEMKDVELGDAAKRSLSSISSIRPDAEMTISLTMKPVCISRCSSGRSCSTSLSGNLQAKARSLGEAMSISRRC